MSEADRAPAALGTALLTLARRAIAQRLGGATPVFLQVVDQADTPSTEIQHALDTQGATFVTLSLHKQLRGCIGTLEAYRPLHADVQENALAAAFRDPRFDPLSADEWAQVRLEVSLLSPPVPMQVSNENDLRQKLRPGVDGVIFKVGHRRATFLPQVWDDLPEPQQFLAQLKQKAGLPADYWSDAVEIARYQVKKWKES